MSRAELKNTLKAQAASYSLDLRRKIKALNNGVDFLTDVSVYGTLQPKAPSQKIFEKNKAPLLPRQPVEIAEAEKTPDKSERERIAAVKKRIALLRGVSLPGEYLIHKSES